MTYKTHRQCPKCFLQIQITDFAHIANCAGTDNPLESFLKGFNKPL
jgi:hypothetical protein